MYYLTLVASFAVAWAAIAFGLATFDIAAGWLGGAPSQVSRYPALFWGLFASHLPAALLGGMATGLIGLSGRPLTGWKRDVSRAAVAVVLCVYPAALLGSSLTSGDWVQAQGYAPALRVGVVVAIALGVAGASFLVARLWESLIARAGYLVCAFAVTLVNASVLPGLYLEVHLGLYVVALLLTTWAVLPEVARGGRWASTRSFSQRPRVFAGVLCAGALCLGACFYLPWMGMRTRADVIRQSTGIATGLSLVAPPIGSDHLARELASLEELASPKEAAEERERTSAFSGRPLGQQPRSVLLIVVDTLRGDALPPVRTGPQPFAAPGDTPHLDAWLETTYRFKNAYAQASQTKASMPSMFRSLEPFEDPLTTGVSLSDFARDLGLRPVAVVPQYFLMPAQPTSQALLEGFEVVDFYTKDAQETLPGKVEGVLDQLGGQPFLAWVHFYNMHSPYYAGPGVAEKGKNGADKYRLALRWLDRQFGVLMRALKERGLDDSTLVILAADHGEHLGEGKRTGHGDGVHDEEVHVPLAFRVPGTEGREVEALAGNLDIVPTIANLFRRSADSSHRGQSLVPVMQEGSSRSNRSLYMISGDERVNGLVTQDHKLVYTPRVATFNLYRRAEDPRDARDLFGVDPLLDRSLVSRFVRYDPTLFAAELKQPEVRRMLARELGTVDPDLGDSALELLLKAARGTNDPVVREQARALYDRSASVEAKLTISRYLGKADAVWAKRWDELLSSVAETPKESFVVRELAAMGAVSIRSSFAPKRLQQLLAAKNLADSKRPVLAAWLDLVAAWPKPARQYGAILSKFLAEPEQTSREDLLGLALKNVGALQGARGKLRAQLEARVLPLTESRDVLLAVAATEASKVSGGKASVARMEQILDSDADPRLRQAALYTLRALRGEKSIPQVLKASEDPLLLIDAIKLSADLRNPLAEPFLREVAENHYNSWTRDQAKAALKRLRKKGR